MFLAERPSAANVSFLEAGAHLRGDAVSARLHGRTLLYLQRLAGNAAVASLAEVQRLKITIGDESVEVADEVEGERARALVSELSQRGVDLNSGVVVDALRNKFSKAPNPKKADLKPRPWRPVELEALLSAATIYGPAVTASAKLRQGRVVMDKGTKGLTAGKTTGAMDKVTGGLDPDTLAQTQGRSIGLCQRSEGYIEPGLFTTEADQLVGTFVHEMAHAILQTDIGSFRELTKDYWPPLTACRQSGLADAECTSTKNAEAPPTKYGNDDDIEDMCESAMLYFLRPSRLIEGDGSPRGVFGNAAPRRFEWMLSQRDRFGAAAWTDPLARLSEEERGRLKSRISASLGRSIDAP